MSFEGTNVVYSTPEVPETTELELTPDDLNAIRLFVTLISDRGNYAAIALQCFYNTSPEAPALFKIAIDAIIGATGGQNCSLPQGIVYAALALDVVRKRAFHSQLFLDGDMISNDLVAKIKEMYFARLRDDL